jgi:type VI secretion system secreted protein VgrG
MSAENAYVFFELGERSLSVRRFSVHEALSQPFEVEALALSPSPAVDISGIVGKWAGLGVSRAGEAPRSRSWTGKCSHMALLKTEPTGESTYLVRIVSELWLLSERRSCRTFMLKTVPEIIKGLLDEWGIGYKLNLTANHFQHDLVVQYDESDLDFLNRLCERAGITYLHDHSDNLTQLVFSDAPHTGEVRADLPRYHDRPPEGHGGEFVTRVRVSEAVRPGAYTLRDFDFRRPPDYPLFGKAEPATMPEGFYEQYHCQPGSMLRVNPPDGAIEATPVADDYGDVRTSEKEGKAMANHGLQGERATRRTVHFQTNCLDLAPGCIFAIDGHPRHDLGPEDHLLVVAFRLEGTVHQTWIYAGEAVRTDVPWVPAIRTPRPNIHGIQSAVVVGPKGEEIHTDEFGRIKVQFHWDRERQFDDFSSPWIRVSQDWAGAGYGSMLIPRIGQEVLVAFLEGDPEQPLVVGRVYNQLNPVPHLLPVHKTRSAWRSDSTAGKEGFNEILFEDKQGGEVVYHQAERDMQKLTKREEVERIAQDRTVIVGKNRQSVVNTVDATMVGKVSVRQMMSPGDAKSLEILEQGVPSLSPHDTTVEMVAGRVLLTTGQATVAFDGASLMFDATGNITLNAKGNDVILEGTRTFINTIPGLPAPQPAPIDPLEPGTFGTTAAPREAPKECEFLNGKSHLIAAPRAKWSNLRSRWSVDKKPVKGKHVFRDGKERDAETYTANVRGKKIDIVTPKNGKEAKQAQPTVNEIAESLTVLSPKQLAVVNKVVLNPTQHSNPGVAADAGCAGVMTVYPNDYYKEHVESLMVHEAGHSYACTVWGKDKFSGPDWEKVMQEDGNFPAGYAKEGPGEDFSESLVMYSLAKGSPCESFAKARYPNRWAYIDKLESK